MELKPIVYVIMYYKVRGIEKSCDGTTEMEDPLGAAPLELLAEST